MDWLWSVAIICGSIFITSILIAKLGLSFLRCIIFFLSIPVWIVAMIYYNDIRTYILFGSLLAFNIIYIYVYGKIVGWWGRK